LRATLEWLASGSDAASRRRARVVIVGGNPRGEEKMARRLFAASPFDVRWQTFEKKQGGAPLQKVVAGVLRRADAVILVTGVLSHVLMYQVKDCAQRYGTPWRCVERATDKQLQAALNELFPELTATWK
jgi:hypothetical protein